MVVDCDSQRNLTYDTCGGALDQYYAANPNGTYQLWITRPRADGAAVGRTLLQILRPMFDDSDLNLAEVELERVPDVENGELWVLCGDEDMSELDREIHKAEVLHPQVPPMKNYLAAPHYAVMKAAKKCNADVVILDLSPSNSELNKVLTLTSSHFLMPSMLDNRALEGMISICDRLTNTSPRGWCFWGEFVGVRNTRNNLFKFPERRPKLLGWTLNGYAIARRGEVVECLREDVLVRNNEGFFQKICRAMRGCILKLETAAQPTYTHENHEWEIPRLYLERDAYIQAKEIVGNPVHPECLELLDRTSDYNQLRIVGQHFFVPVPFISPSRGQLVRYESNPVSAGFGDFVPVPDREKAKMRDSIRRHRQDLDLTVKVILRLLRRDYPDMPDPDAPPPPHDHDNGHDGNAGGPGGGGGGKSNKKPPSRSPGKGGKRKDEATSHAASKRVRGAAQ